MFRFSVVQISFQNRVGLYCIMWLSFLQDVFCKSASTKAGHTVTSSGSLNSACRLLGVLTCKPFFSTMQHLYTILFCTLKSTMWDIDHDLHLGFPRAICGNLWLLLFTATVAAQNSKGNGANAFKSDDNVFGYFLFYFRKKKMKCNVYPTSYYLSSPMPPIFHHKLPWSNHPVFHPLQFQLMPHAFKNGANSHCLLYLMKLHHSLLWHYHQHKAEKIGDYSLLYSSWTKHSAWNHKAWNLSTSSRALVLHSINIAVSLPPISGIFLCEISPKYQKWI